jgi:hypothetical protein
VKTRLNKLSFVTILIAVTGVLGMASKKVEKNNPPPTPRAPSGVQSSAESVWVTRPDGAQSCAPKSGITLTEGAEDLKEAKIPILDSRKGSDGKMHVQMCGASQGTTNSFLIPKARLSDALALGYQEARH